MNLMIMIWSVSFIILLVIIYHKGIWRKVEWLESMVVYKGLFRIGAHRSTPLDAVCAFLFCVWIIILKMTYGGLEKW